MTPKQLVDTATRHQVLLEGFKTGQVRDFQSVFSKLDKSSRDILNSLNVEKLSEISRTKLEKTLGAIQQSQTDLFSEAIDQFVDGMKDVSGSVADFEAKAIKSVMTAKGRGTIETPTAEEAFKEAKRRPVQATGQLLEDMVQKFSERAIQATNGAIRTGYDQGKTVPQILKQLQGTEQLRFKDGVTAVNKRHAATVVRTSVQHVAHTAREVTYEQNSDVVKGVEWVSTLDGHTTTQCRSLDGKKFKINEGPRPPIHPNCRSTTAPDLNEEFDFLDKGATRSSQDGYVDANETYYSWLQKQDQAFQDKVLGETRGKLLRDGGLTSQQFADLQLDKNFQPLTLAQMKEAHPLAFQRAGLLGK